MRCSAIFALVNRFYALALAAVLLGGCAPKNDFMDSEAVKQALKEEWEKYLENDGSIAQVALFTQDAPNQPQDGDKIGFALARTNGSKPLKIGDMFMSGGQFVIVRDLQQDRDVNLNDEDEMMSLGGAKSVKFYEFGNGIFETIVYSADKPLCMAFYIGESIRARAVTNYNIGQNGEFFATLIQSEVKFKSESKLVNLGFKFFVKDENLAKVRAQAMSEDFKQRVINNDLKKQERVLRNIVCAAFETYEPY
ncbi:MULTISPECIES: hypothetical protein [Campylobacter]|uniref:hypothetical protein n=1 Tax=Campylobacter TaxID=194 RepID=UPI00146FD88E|nr:MULTISPECIES: hypothetical protein [Campylobacter]MBN7288397.1 hypothetical protein [Campylobacter curvus]MDU6827398.1 hypothetical protein [Campylobacter sp.]